VAPSHLFTAFHETLTVNLSIVAGILGLACTCRASLTTEKIREEMRVGTNQAKVMPRYARGCGFLEFGSYSPTVVGRAVYERDPYLQDERTLWLMHYHLSAPHGPGPAFWSHLVCHGLPYAELVTTESIISRLAEFLRNELGMHTLAQRTVESTVTVFVGTYTKPEGLGRLGFLSVADPANEKCVIVNEPKSPPVGVVAYALADYWEANYGDQVTMDLDILYREHGFARILWTAPNLLEKRLEELRRRGIVDIHRVAPPYQVTRRWRSKGELLSLLYG
jgi:hypothetical protein